MSERYTRLFSLPENLGLEDCPVVISAGALLKDNVTGNVLVQLKLRNLSPQAVNAVKVKIHAYDTAKTELNGVEAFSYQDLNIPLDGEFGSQTPIPLPDAATHSFTVDILSVTLADGTVYSPTEAQASSNEEVLNKVKQLDKGRIASAHWRQLFRLSFIPLLLVVIAFGCHILYFYCLYPSSNLIKSYPKLRDYAIKFLKCRGTITTMLVPCMCILASWGSKRFPKAPTVAFVTCIVCLAIQCLCAVFFAICGYINSPLRKERWFFLLWWYIRGTEFFRNRHWTFWLEGDLRLIKMYLELYLVLDLRDILYFAKNISAAVILYQHVKSIKRGTL